MSHRIKLLLQSISVSFWVISNMFWCRVSILVWFLTVSPHCCGHYCLLPWVISSIPVSLPCVKNPWNNSLCVYIYLYIHTQYTYIYMYIDIYILQFCSCWCNICYLLQWVPVLSDFQSRHEIWSFIPGKPSQPLALHFGDYNLDGFPDALAVLRNTSGR